MTFGQHSGPPASAKQVQELLALLQAAGHSDWRDARGPMGFTQRQAAGKFTRDEAAEFIDLLQDAQLGASGPGATTPTATLSADDRAIRRLPTGQLVTELRRRGCMVIEP